MYCARRILVLSLVTVFLQLALLPARGQGTRTRVGQQPTAAERDHPRQRELWFRRGRSVKGQPAAALLYRAYRQKMRKRALRQAQRASSFAPLLATTSSLAGASGPWEALGPAPLESNATGFADGDQDYGAVSGRATAVAVDPGDPTGNTVYLGGAFGGLWKSDNAANSTPAAVAWTPLLDDQPTLAVGALALQPTAPGVKASLIVVGTGEANSSADSYYGLGILRSTDAGNTWTLIDSADNGAHPFRGLAFSKIAFSTSDPNLVVAASAAASVGIIEGAQSISTTRGLYTSTDAGLTWRYASVKDGSATVSPGSATSVVYNAAGGKFFAALRFHGFYSSTDGLNWTRLPAQPGPSLGTTSCPAQVTLPSDCPIYRGEIAVVPGRNEMYVWYVDVNDNDQGIFQSTDGGSHWTPISTAGIANCGDSHGCGTQQGFFNLALAAVPNGATATDLYAGAINIFKCKLSSTLNPTCSSEPFINLTHSYGCGTIGAPAHLHPDQHDFSFVLVNPSSQVIIYFANDGGIYRALNGYDPRFDGSCAAGSDPFDNLNAALGSMTQFVSFSQHPTDPHTLLGGTQDNGSPATASAASADNGKMPWQSVNGGDGGFNAINPGNPAEWFTANTDVSIQRCETGINCRQQDFVSASVVTNTTVGGDQGPFYTPYMLDPRASGRMLVGTCRVWRGNSNGSSFAALSNNFDTDTGIACTGQETQLIRALAAGGPTTANGSQVIYASTDGGPDVNGRTQQGKVWVTTNADGGEGTWQDMTAQNGDINPSSFPISSIALDPADATGKTAYVTIMGFGVPHAFKTTNAGVTWTDISGDSNTLGLPDAPANSILVDPDNSNVLYAGTDVGVFTSGDGGATWIEVGPASGAGQLPNVAVTRLSIFKNSSSKRLRASTYGRGMWESVVDFELNIANPELTVFPDQSATYNGVLTAPSGYNFAVNISCEAGATAPPACTPAPSSVIPSPAGSAFQVTAPPNGSTAEFAFNIRGRGTDPEQVTHAAPVKLHVADFTVTALPSSVPVNRGSISPPVTISVTGSYTGAVNFSCAALPAGTTCRFTPPSLAATPGQAALIVSTTAGAPLGPSIINVVATGASSSGSEQRSAPLTVIVGNAPDYNLALAASSFNAFPGGTVSIALTLTAANGYKGKVNIGCDVSAIPGATCAVSKTPVNLAGGSGSSSVSVKLKDPTPAGGYTIKVKTSDSTGSPAHDLPATVTVTDFRLPAASGSASIKAGQSATYTLNITPQAGGFSSPISFACSGLPAQSRCSFSPATVTPNNAVAQSTLTISTTSSTAWLPRPPGLPVTRPLYALWLPLVMGGLLLGGSRRGKIAAYLGFCLLAILLSLQAACGGGGGGGPTPANPAPPPPSGTPPGTYSVKVTATATSPAGTLSRATTVTLTVQ